ncbi:hypothetical protein [Nitrogeniibacter aestuarii]|uniref:hypothetical protein n=1 Tax=Nitrogeniibacter aestuarii TaxID=2815343 RepID=UPI001D0F61E1|nr:hypothetical protein [Nitrogeniibacter aestuarii]
MNTVTDPAVTNTTTNPIKGEAVGRAKESFGEVQSATKKLIHDGSDVVKEGAAAVETAVREGATRLEETATKAADKTAVYVQEQPLKALLIAAGTGALIALAAGAAARRHR